MRFLFRWAFRLILLLIVLAVALFLAKDALFKAYLERQLRAATGLETHIESADIGIFEPSLTVEGLKIYNGPAFGGSPFIDMPELHMEYDPNALAERKLHFTLVRVDLNNVHVVENGGGKSNLQVLQERTQKAKEQEKKNPFEFAGIDIFNLTWNKISFTDMRRPNQVREISIGLHNEVVRNVHSPEDLAGLLLSVLTRNGIRGLELPPVASPPGRRAPPKRQSWSFQQFLEPLVSFFRKK